MLLRRGIASARRKCSGAPNRGRWV